MRFRDRNEAGILLAARLGDLGLANPQVLALPRGGVPVGAQVARVLGCPLDVLIVRKVGVPWNTELAMGAVGEGGVTHKDAELVKRLGVTDEIFTEAAAAERKEVARRAERYRTGTGGVEEGTERSLAKVSGVRFAGADVILVDDGVATGASALAAADVTAQLRPSSITFAAPVGPPGAINKLKRVCDHVVCLEVDSNLGAVGQYYDDFHQLSDDEVVAILKRQ